ncbi:streptomycin biosynthesis protein [Nocardia panacis]|uniref:Streptomycin biosynthesis protein n=1 Tax=Nocardia panacis TaxID=2340916 RepID=A0A3A4KZ79_9NOCA|nr:ParB N-terminal domain-containing protein [Nocardia panacis]RJO79264.1 streptomycin biosynthesis protein [Nocardia panacis]
MKEQIADTGVFDYRGTLGCAIPISGDGVSGEIVEIPIDAVESSEFLRVRAVDSGHTQLLAQSLQTLPPIVVHRDSMHVIDGLHRLAAARSKGLRTIPVRYFDGSAEAAFVLAVQSNIAHGLPLSLKDRKVASLRIMLMYPTWSDRRIGVITGLDHKTVGAIRRRAAGEIPQTPARLGRDGRVRRLREPAAPRAETARPRTLRGHAAVVRAVSPSTQPAAATLIDRLRRDPSLRLSETGRQLLRWLDAAPRTKAESVELAGQLPEHCLNLIHEMARQNAQHWQGFAAMIGDRLDARVGVIAPAANS